MTITLYKFGKKLNSTKLPLVAGITVRGNLRTPTTILNPVIEISYNGMPDFNYCRIVEFGRYYYITNVTCETDALWTLTLSEDVLASYRDEIGDIDAYVLRSSYDADGEIIYDGNIVDSTYPITAEAATYIVNSIESPFSGDDDEAGCFIVGIINSSSGTGATTYYAMTPYEFRNFNAYLFNSVNWLDISASEISDNLQRALINPYQYIVSCMFCPFTVNQLNVRGMFAPTKSAIKFGWWTAGSLTAYEVPNWSFIRGTASITIPKHPQQNIRGKYLNLSPYSAYTLRFYPFGTLTLDSQILAGYSTLELEYIIDMPTGMGTLNLSVAGTNNIVRTVQANIFAPIPTAAMTTDFANLSTGTLIGATALGASQGEFFSSLAEGKRIDKVAQALGRDISNPQTYSNIVTAAASMLSSVECQSEQGTIGQLWQRVLLSGRFNPIATEDFEHRGRPLCQHRVINTLRGYIQIADDDLDINCTEPELSAITAQLRSGFYYE